MLFMLQAMVVGALEPFDSWPIKSSALLRDFAGFVLLAMILPFTVPIPKRNANPFSLEFTPILVTWNVWMSWLSVCGFVYYLTRVIRGIITSATLDYHAIQLCMFTLWMAWLKLDRKSRWWPPIQSDGSA